MKGKGAARSFGALPSLIDLLRALSCLVAEAPPLLEALVQETQISNFSASVVAEKKRSRPAGSVGKVKRCKDDKGVGAAAAAAAARSEAAHQGDAGDGDKHAEQGASQPASGAAGREGGSECGVGGAGGGDGGGGENGDGAVGGSSMVALGSLVEVRLDDDTKALAVVSDVPRAPPQRGIRTLSPSGSSSADDKYEVTFMDDHGRLALRDRLMLSLPNEFVEVVYACEPAYTRELPRGWIPVPLEQGTCFVGPEGQMCSSLDEVRRKLVSGS